MRVNGAEPWDRLSAEGFYDKEGGDGPSGQVSLIAVA